MTMKLEIYQGAEGEVFFDVDEMNQTIWAEQGKIAELFEVDRTVISRHLRNIFVDEELEAEKCVKEEVEERLEGNRRIARRIKKYNLDVIISVGYRVNSKKATKFRIWASSIIKRYMTEGVAVNYDLVKKLPEQSEKLQNLEETLGIVRRMLTETSLSANEANGVLEVVTKYADSFATISEYLNNKIIFSVDTRARRDLSEVEIENYVSDLRERLNESENFGVLAENNRGETLISARIQNLFERSDSVARRAAKLLYFIVHEKPFLEGNQQIGALLFVVYLSVNFFQLNEQGETKLSDRALTALVLLIAESQPEEKELMLNLICKLLDK
ncbi:MAG: virulence RhuM family protein [Candidatus Nanosynbacter sp.]|nr:virulence RhuM family protein [Candidatus Nanosynbacter sp.]